MVFIEACQPSLYCQDLFIKYFPPFFLHGHLVYFEADDWKQVPPRLWCYHNKHLNFSFSSNRYLSRVKHTQSLPLRCSGLGQKSKQRDSALLTDRGYWSLDGQPGGLNNCHSGVSMVHTMTTGLLQPGPWSL